MLARELTFEEVRDVTAAAGVETEVFIHGALCYSYSGLCLFSAQTLGRSGNRGKCAYSCRDSYEVTGAPLELRDGSPVTRDPRTGFPFSMKDLALPDHIPAPAGRGRVVLQDRGPQEESALRRHDHRLLPQTARRPLARTNARPWKPTCKRCSVGRGRGCSCNRTRTRKSPTATRSAIAARQSARSKRSLPVTPPTPRLRFRTSRPLERHDGLQVDLPILGKPFGFAVDNLWIVTSGRWGKRKEVFEAPAGALVEVGLPRDHPALPTAAPVYCSSSQAVKQRYRHERPKPGLFHTRRAVDIDVVTHRRRPDGSWPHRAGGRGSPHVAGTVRSGEGRRRHGRRRRDDVRQTRPDAVGVGVVRLRQRCEPLRPGVAPQPVTPRTDGGRWNTNWDSNTPPVCNACRPK